MPSAFVFEIASCTLRACEPLANELARLGLYAPAVSEWTLDNEGNGRTAGLDAIINGMSSGTKFFVEVHPVP
ncbi:hypothetical protein MSAR_40920 [Mycolicibacterium sarraceniae]|uniref:Uncharacterized protein n=1 Tax=Mycolicibacterium sarraceniae TaxID=1534348 RepID=A0A7I7SYQ9_9MYCO|nr:hypothetical protein MSAR_40920 [Mycolicibacterium sarraceniae]